MAISKKGDEVPFHGIASAPIDTPVLDDVQRAFAPDVAFDPLGFAYKSDHVLLPINSMFSRQEPSSHNPVIFDTAFSDTIAGSTATTSSLVMGAASTGYVNTSVDSDWFRIHMIAGVTYRLSETMSGTPLLHDPNLEVRNSSGAVLTSYGHNSLFGLPTAQYTPATTGDYYISTSSADGTTGAYSLQLEDKIANSTLTAFSLAQGVHTYGILETTTDSDWYAVTLTAGVTYDFAAGSYSSDGVKDTALELHSNTGALLANNDDASAATLDSLIHYTAPTSGTYYLAATSSSAATSSEKTGIYDVHFDVSNDVYAANTTTTGTLSEGGSVSSAIDTVGDNDWFAVTLQAGYIYDFTLTGSGSSPLQDPYLELFNSAGTFLTFDDDSGPGHDSNLAFYAQTSGTYYISAESYQNAAPFTNIGGYTLGMGTKVTPTVDTIPQNGSTTAVLTLGQSQAGIIDTPGDSDWYAVNLTIGTGYDFDLTGANGFDVALNLYDSNGQLIAINDNFGTGTDSHLDFEPDSSGLYYLAATGSGGTQYGNYTIAGAVGDRPLLTSSIDWGTKLNPAGGVVHVYFAPAGETYDGETSLGWNTYETQQAMAALAVYSQYINLTFVQTTDVTQADFKLVTANDLGGSDGGSVVAYMNPPGTTNAGVGVFATNVSGTWSSTPGGALEPGGFGFETLLHELGHGLGLAHPFDNGGTSTVMTGLLNTNDYIGYGYQNQGIYTVMTYNDGWPGGPVPGEAGYNHGYDATPMAIDVAALQAKYGSNPTYHNGDDTYFLDSGVSNQSQYQSIWDTGGTDTISSAHLTNAQNAVIDLRPATMYYTTDETTNPTPLYPDHAADTSGGAPSYVQSVDGGITVDAGVNIENATGHLGSDLIYGNDLNNVINGMGGNDTIYGGGGDDAIAVDLTSGPAGVTTVDGGTGNDTLTMNVAHSAVTGSELGGVVTLTTAAGITLNASNIESFVFTDGTFNYKDVVKHPPSITGTLRASIDAGGAHVLTTQELGFTDIDNTSTTFKVSPVDGWITVNGYIATQFTSDQLAAGDVSFVRGNAVTNVDLPSSFFVQAFDGTLYSTATTFTFATVAGQIDNLFLGGTANGDTLSTADGNDTLVGLGGDDYLYAFGGNDYLQGGDGNDYLWGGAGSDILDGGAGTDMAMYQGYGSVHAYLDNPTLNTGDAAGDTYISIEGLIGGYADDILGGDSGNNILTGLSGNDILNGGAGADTMYGGSGDDTYYVDNVGDVVSEQTNVGFNDGGIDTVVASISYALVAYVENLTLTGTANLTGTGNSLDNVITVNNGNDIIDGGAGNDTAVLGFASTAATTVNLNGVIYVTNLTTGDTDQLTNIETLQFSDKSEAASVVPNFNALEYLASNPDLLAGYGDNPQAAAQHYVAHGFAEHRQTASFDATEYLDSNPDLLAGFGNNPAAALQHYVDHGFAEHRQTTGFNALEYLASNPDLLAAFGDNPVAAEYHYAQFGYSEHRQTTSFDATEYLDSNPDLLAGFGNNPAAALQHYVDHGFAEHRQTTGFNALEYLASNPDLLAAFGDNPVAAEYHYAQFGYSEHRQTTSFDATEYLDSNPDLLAGFGNNPAAALQHYVDHGFAEHRQTTSFDAMEYLASNPDLLVAFGDNTQAAEYHYAQFGYSEHRQTSSFDPLEFLASNPTLIATLGDNPAAIEKYYVDFGYSQHLATNSFNATQYLANYSDLSSAYGHDLHAAELHYVLFGYNEHRTDHLLA